MTMRYLVACDAPGCASMLRTDVPIWRVKDQALKVARKAGWKVTPTRISELVTAEHLCPDCKPPAPRRAKR